MSDRITRLRRSAPLAAAILAARVAAAADQPAQPAACVDAYVRGQKESQQGRLVDARRDFLQCAQPSCPSVTTRDCARWGDELDARIPTVVLGMQDGSGHARADVRVSIDGAPLAASLDGRAVAVDPGKHVFRFEAAGEPPVEREVVVLEGVKAQVVAVDERPPSPPASTTTPVPAPSPSPAPAPAHAPAKASTPAIVWALGGIGALGIASFAYFAITGSSEESDLRARCAAGCTPEDADSGKSAIRAKYAIADVSLAFGAIALGAATWLYLHPVAGGAVASLQGRFR